MKTTFYHDIINQSEPTKEKINVYEEARGNFSICAHFIELPPIPKIANKTRSAKVAERVATNEKIKCTCLLLFQLINFFGSISNI